QGGVARADGVVLVRQGRAEECHDAVAHHLVDRPFIVMDGLHHPLENRVQQLPSFLRIPVGEELHRSFEVGEEHCDLFALAFQGGLRGEDLLSEMLRSVCFWRAESTWIGSSCITGGVSTLWTELRGRREFIATL